MNKEQIISKLQSIRCSILNDSIDWYRRYLCASDARLQVDCYQKSLISKNYFLEIEQLLREATELD